MRSNQTVDSSTNWLTRGLLVAVLLTTVLGGAACAKKSDSGGGSTAAAPPPPPPPPPPAPVDDYSTGKSGYAGAGEWGGLINVTNPDLYREFLLDNEICLSRRRCAPAGNKFDLRFQVLADLVPADANVQIIAFGVDPNNGVRKEYRKKYVNPAKAEINAQDNGLLLTTYRYADGQLRPQIVDSALGSAGGEPELRIRTRWINQYRDQMNVEVFYLTQRIAEGVVEGRLFDRRYRSKRGGRVSVGGGQISFEGGYDSGSGGQTVRGAYDGNTGFFEYNGSNFSIGVSRDR